MENIERVKPNPLLERVKIPGETIRLPSGGIFYVAGELSPEVTNGEIHIYPLTTISEIMLRSPDKLLNGDALFDVFAQCAPQIIKPMGLLARDVDYLMTCIRKVTYGDNLEVNYKHTCEGATEHTYVLSLSKIISDSKPIDPTSLNKSFAVVMSNGQTVKLQPMRFSNMVEIMQSVRAIDPDSNSDRLMGMQLIKSVSCMITAVDEIEDNEMIREWLTSIPKTWFNDISKAIEEGSQWGPDFEYKTTCKDCGEEIDLSVTLNPLTFFI